MALCPPRNKFSKTTTARHSSRRLCCIERKKVTRRLAAHVHNVGRAHRGPQRSLQLIVWGWNMDFPPEDPLCLVRLFREEGLFFVKRNLHWGSTGWVSPRSKLIATGGSSGAGPMRGLSSGVIGARPTIDTTGGASWCSAEARKWIGEAGFGVGPMLIKRQGEQPRCSTDQEEQYRCLADA